MTKTTTIYRICNNYNVQEKATMNANDAEAFAQQLADQSEMPAFVDVYVNGICIEDKCYRVDPAKIIKDEKGAYKMVMDARNYICNQRQAGLNGIDTFIGDRAYRQTWTLLFAAENLLAGGPSAHYERILNNQGSEIA